jgi:hypothetical protein
MADQIKLKAFVRIDGSGKVIPGGPILQAQKPKVGKWREINVKECCNYIPGSTTTTSTSSTSTTTSTSTSTTTTTTTTPTVYDFVGGYGVSSAGEACFGGMTQTFYSTTPYGSVTNGSVLYNDVGLTMPVTFAYVALTGLGIVFSCSSGVLSGQAPC